MPRVCSTGSKATEVRRTDGWAQSTSGVTSRVPSAPAAPGGQPILQCPAWVAHPLADSKCAKVWRGWPDEWKSTTSRLGRLVPPPRKTRVRKSARSRRENVVMPVRSSIYLLECYFASTAVRTRLERRIGPSVGKMNQNVDPRPTMDSTPMVPPCISTNFLQRANPRPVP